MRKKNTVAFLISIRIYYSISTPEKTHSHVSDARKGPHPSLSDDETGPDVRAVCL